jgi:hypothetical protein
MGISDEVSVLQAAPGVKRKALDIDRRWSEEGKRSCSGIRDRNGGEFLSLGATGVRIGSHGDYSYDILLSSASASCRSGEPATDWGEQ